MVLFLGDVSLSWYSKLLHYRKMYYLAMLQSSNPDSFAKKLRVIIHCLMILREVLMKESVYEENVSSRTYINVPLPPLQDMPRLINLLHSNYFVYLERCRHHVRVVQFAQECLLESELTRTADIGHCTETSSVAPRKNLPLNKIHSGVNTKVVPPQGNVQCDNKNHSPVQRTTNIDQGQGSSLPASKKRCYTKTSAVPSYHA